MNIEKSKGGFEQMAKLYVKPVLRMMNVENDVVTTSALGESTDYVDVTEIFKGGNAQ